MTKMKPVKVRVWGLVTSRRAGMSHGGQAWLWALWRPWRPSSWGEGGRFSWPRASSASWLLPPETKVDENIHSFVCGALGRAPAPFNIFCIKHPGVEESKIKRPTRSSKRGKEVATRAFGKKNIMDEWEGRPRQCVTARLSPAKKPSSCGPNSLELTTERRGLEGFLTHATLLSQSQGLLVIPPLLIQHRLAPHHRREWIQPQHRTRVGQRVEFPGRAYHAFAATEGGLDRVVKRGLGVGEDINRNTSLVIQGAYSSQWCANAGFGARERDGERGAGARTESRDSEANALKKLCAVVVAPADVGWIPTQIPILRHISNTHLVLVVHDERSSALHATAVAHLSFAGAQALRLVHLPNNSMRKTPKATHLYMVARKTSHHPMPYQKML
ncbi:hypothetical protein MSG28_015967 [Choristoneura fumiferana]|uniref:Uncharacterized protein n=1 Tax=Choristoneura fumiferana TaxID=7141 RepID=A0ACC0K4U7_CHOFU|nr:hypothetical protein MSG28_015967 [Choristoneura fumiferana]